MSTLRAEKVELLEKTKKLGRDLSASNTIIANLRAKETNNNSTKCLRNTPPRPILCRSGQTISPDIKPSIVSCMSERRQHFRGMKITRVKSLAKRSNSFASESGAPLSGSKIRELETKTKMISSKNKNELLPPHASKSNKLNQSPNKSPQMIGGRSCLHENLREQNTAALVSPEGSTPIVVSKTPIKLCLDQDENKPILSSSTTPTSSKSKLPMKKSMLLRKKHLLLKYEQSRRRLSPLAAKNS